jgi:hypothetical protein
MKKLQVLLIVLFAFSVSFTACQKDVASEYEGRLNTNPEMLKKKAEVVLLAAMQDYLLVTGCETIEVSLSLSQMQTRFQITCVTPATLRSLCRDNTDSLQVQL